MGEWEEFDTCNDEGMKDSLMTEYKQAFGQGYMWKWENAS